MRGSSGAATLAPSTGQQERQGMHAPTCVGIPDCPDPPSYCAPPPHPATHTPHTQTPPAPHPHPPRSSLYPNVDFYSGIVLRALGIPVEMYTVLFAMARTVGWVAQASARACGRMALPVAGVGAVGWAGVQRQRGMQPLKLGYIAPLCGLPPTGCLSPRPPLPQWKEMVADATGRITRPRQIYTGELRRKFVPVYERQLSGRIPGEEGCCLAPAASRFFALAITCGPRGLLHGSCTRGDPKTPPSSVHAMTVDPGPLTARSALGLQRGRWVSQQPAVAACGHLGPHRAALSGPARRLAGAVRRLRPKSPRSRQGSPPAAAQRPGGGLSRPLLRRQRLPWLRLRRWSGPLRQHRSSSMPPQACRRHWRRNMMRKSSMGSGRRSRLHPALLPHLTGRKAPPSAWRCLPRRSRRAPSWHLPAALPLLWARCERRQKHDPSSNAQQLKLRHTPVFPILPLDHCCCSSRMLFVSSNAPLRPHACTIYIPCLTASVPTNPLHPLAA